MNSKNNHTDDELVSGIQNGSEDAFALLYKRYERKLMGYLIFKLKHPEIADEVFQISWSKALDHIHRYKLQSSFSSWLFAIASNSVKDWFKKSRNQEKLLTAFRNEAIAKTLLPEEEPSLNIDFLKPEAKKIIKLKYIEGLNSKEISKELNLTESNVRKIASRARLEIKKHLINGGSL